MCHSGRSKKTLIKDKIGTCHFTDFGLCKASLIEHLSVTELPAWAWISGLPSMVTTGTGKRKENSIGHFCERLDKHYNTNF